MILVGARSRDLGIMPLICPTCQADFGKTAGVREPSSATVHGVVFDIFVVWPGSLGPDPGSSRLVLLCHNVFIPSS